MIWTAFAAYNGLRPTDVLASCRREDGSVLLAWARAAADELGYEAEASSLFLSTLMRSWRATARNPLQFAIAGWSQDFADLQDGCGRRYLEYAVAEVLGDRVETWSVGSAQVVLVRHGHRLANTEPDGKWVGNIYVTTRALSELERDLEPHRKGWDLQRGDEVVVASPPPKQGLPPRDDASATQHLASIGGCVTALWYRAT